jgi:hypothetical protein
MAVIPLWYFSHEKRLLLKPINSREEEYSNMMPQKSVNESVDEQASSTYYGNHEADQEYARQRDELPYEQPLREGPGRSVYLPQMDNTNLFRLLVFVIAMVTLLVFVVVCLVLVGGTGGWISFCAASFAILVITSTLIGIKQEGAR